MSSRNRRMANRRPSRGAVPIVASSGADTPLTILGSKLEVWWDADDSDTITTAGSDVTAWADKSGNSHDLSEATNPPSHDATGGANSKGVVNFDGVAEELSTAGNFTFTTGDRPSAYIVAKFNNTTGTERLWVMNESNSTMDMRLVAGGGGTWQCRTVYEGSQFQQWNHTDSPDTNFHLFALHYRTSNRTFAIDGTEVDGSGSEAILGFTNGIIALASRASAEFCNCGICEFVMSNDALTAGEEASIESYFATKFGLTIE